MPATPETDYARGIGLLLVATLGWSLSGIFVRLLPELDGWQINCWRGIATAVTLSAFLLMVHGRNTIAHVRSVPWQAMVIYAAFFMLGSTLYVTSLTLASTATVAAIGAMAPIVTAILGFVLIGERPGLATWIAAVIAVAGVAIIFRDGLVAGHWLGVVAAITTNIIFSLQLILLRRYRGVDMTPAVVLGGIATFLVGGLIGNGLVIPEGTLGLVLVMGVVQLALPAILFVRGARSVPAVTISLVVLFEAVLNPLWTYIGVGEVPSADAMIGCAIIISAVLMSVIAGARIARSVNQAAQPADGGQASVPAAAGDQPR